MRPGPARGCANGCVLMLAVYALAVIAFVTLGRVL